MRIAEYDLTGFSINNFRVFGSETSFKLAPLTILTGTNSSGKSSFTKALNLLTRSYKKNGLSKLELMESDLKIGGFDAIKNSLNKIGIISFGIEVEIRKYEDAPEKFNFLLSYNSEGLISLKIFNEDSEPLLIQESENFKGKLIINKTFIKVTDSVLNKTELKKEFKDLSEDNFNLICDSILDYLQNSSDAHTRKDQFYYDFFEMENYDIIEGGYKRILDGLELIGAVETVKQNYFDTDLNQEVPYENLVIFSANPKLKEILPTVIMNIIDVSVLDTYLSKYLVTDSFKTLNIFPTNIFKDLFSRFEFIDGVRATQEIVYTKENSSSFYELIEEYYSLGSFNRTIGTKWIVDEFKLIKLGEWEDLNDVFKIIQIPGYGYMLQITKDGHNINLSGLGYGVTQLLPILLKVSLCKNSIFIIEEPESNLHPALQSKLADFFSEAIKSIHLFNRANRFIIETHSEYLIRKLQYLTAKGTIEEDQTQLYYFNHPDNIPAGEEQVKQININKDGSLTDNFGEGFFDEATSWKFQLLKLNNPQKN